MQLMRGRGAQGLKPLPLASHIPFLAHLKYRENLQRKK